VYFVRFFYRDKKVMGVLCVFRAPLRINTKICSTTTTHLKLTTNMQVGGQCLVCIIAISRPEHSLTPNQERGTSTSQVCRPSSQGDGQSAQYSELLRLARRRTSKGILSALERDLSPEDRIAKRRRHGVDNQQPEYCSGGALLAGDKTAARLVVRSVQLLTPSIPQRLCNHVSAAARDTDYSLRDVHDRGAVAGHGHTV
jgi:hypothetical protein